MNLTPKQIVAYLDQFIIGQDKAKRAIAIAYRNRLRRALLPPDLKDEVKPINILLIGSTGTGKSELARRLAKLSDAPFVKVDATKFTEVGYVGRDVDSIIRDLANNAFRILINKRKADILPHALQLAKQRILDLLIPSNNSNSNLFNSNSSSRDFLLNKLNRGELDNQPVEISIPQSNPNQLNLLSGLDSINDQLNDLISSFSHSKSKKRSIPIKDALPILTNIEADNLIDSYSLYQDTVNLTQAQGIVFIDEFDKIASGSEYRVGADVSREGVQRDILPIVEGSVVNTKYGPLKTDHILFIGAGAFHTSKPTDLIPELQGRFPIRVELQPLDKETFVKILTVPENAIIKQNQALLATENIQLEFTDDAIDELADMAFLMNEQTENIGARRLHTIMEKLLEEISYDIPETGEKPFVIDREYVKNRFSDTIDKDDVDKYIL